ncbi:MAG: YtxH domain-containing protein [Brumimicrobium sp.]|nr:YtxH domain-containing protein [Brumimicrobium sp.]
MSRNTGDILLGVLAGAAVGAGIGILMAPDKGSNTRKKIKNKFDSSKEDVMEKFEELASMVRRKTGNYSSEISDAIDEALEETGADKKEMIALLEKKLESLKKVAK